MATGNYPLDCWYVGATSDEVDRAPLGRRLLDVPVVLYRQDSGQVVALADRCAHRAYPLSKGRLDGDLLVCGYHGLRYNAAGECVHVPSQTNVPYDVCVRAFPVREEPPFIWVWPGDPRRSLLSPLPELPSLSNDDWRSSGTWVRARAHYMLLLEHYVDVTHIPEVHRDETPPGLDEMPPLEQVAVTETSVSYTRTLPPAPLADWEGEVTGLPNRPYHRTHHGTLYAPSVIAETWEITGPGDEFYTVARVNAVTPETATTTHLFFRIGRNFALEYEPVGRHLHAVMEQVMRGDVELLETLQERVGYEGVASGVNISADAGALHVRRIVEAMLASEAGEIGRRFATAWTTA
jgi:vanillate O-demethylase monooxygenase subunit